MRKYNRKIQLNTNRNQKMSLKMSQCQNHLTEYSDLNQELTTGNPRFYAVYEIKEEISFGEEHRVAFNVDLDESTDDASRRRKSDSEETVKAINESVLEIAKSYGQPAPVSNVEKSRDETLSKGRGEKTGSDNIEANTNNEEDVVEATKTLTRVRKNLRVWPNSSSRIIYVEKDFASSKVTKAILTTADCKFDRELEREIHKGLKNEEFIFNQRRPVGSVAIQPHSLNQEGFDVYYLFVRATALQPVLLEDLKKATQQLRTELEYRIRISIFRLFADSLILFAIAASPS